MYMSRGKSSASIDEEDIERITITISGRTHELISRLKLRRKYRSLSRLIYDLSKESIIQRKKLIVDVKTPTEISV